MRSPVSSRTGWQPAMSLSRAPGRESRSTIWFCSGVITSPGRLPTASPRRWIVSSARPQRTLCMRQHGPGWALRSSTSRSSDSPCPRRWPPVPPTRPAGRSVSPPIPRKHTWCSGPFSQFSSFACTTRPRNTRSRSDWTVVQPGSRLHGSRIHLPRALFGSPCVLAAGSGTGSVIGAHRGEHGVRALPVPAL